MKPTKAFRVRRQDEPEGAGVVYHAHRPQQAQARALFDLRESGETCSYYELRTVRAPEHDRAHG